MRIPTIPAELQALMTEWRHDFHRHPEFGFEERRTAAIVADKLKSFGIDVAEGVGGTGVVGTLRRGTSNRAVPCSVRSKPEGTGPSETPAEPVTSSPIRPDGPVA